VAQDTTHTVQFDTSEKPVMISGDTEKSVQGVNTETEERFKQYLPVEDSNKTESVKKNSPMIDFGLETLSGDPYTVNAENLSKFMIA
jgi:hypothetical protein